MTKGQKVKALVDLRGDDDPEFLVPKGTIGTIITGPDSLGNLTVEFPQGATDVAPDEFAVLN